MRNLTFILLAVIALTSVASSQPELYLGGGIAFPAGPKTFTDGWKMGFNADGGIGFALSPAASFILSVGYASFPVDVSGMMAQAGAPSGANHE